MKQTLKAIVDARRMGNSSPSDYPSAHQAFIEYNKVLNELYLKNKILFKILVFFRII